MTTIEAVEEKDSVVVFRSMDGQLHTLNNTNLINFKLL